MILKTVDLITIGEASKALKQKNFIYYNGYLYGLDNIDGYLVYVWILDDLHDKCNEFNGMIFNAREISAFIKAITTETEFNIVYDINGKCILSSNITDKDGNIINMTIANGCSFIQMINTKISQLSPYIKSDNIDITADLQQLFSMKKTEGCFYYKPNIFGENLFITLFPGLLPLNKSDKVLLSLINFTNKFISFFTVVKKKFKVTVVVCYLKV